MCSKASASNNVGSVGWFLDVWDKGKCLTCIWFVFYPPSMGNVQQHYCCVRVCDTYNVASIFTFNTCFMLTPSATAFGVASVAAEACATDVGSYGRGSSTTHVPA